MNYKPITIDKFLELADEFPNYSFGELLHSFLRGNMLKGKPENKATSWLMEIDDKDFYTAIERAISSEQE